MTEAPPDIAFPASLRRLHLLDSDEDVA
ncbi:MAG: hypothetical protein JWN72_1101, partial [Thermoleophilia bacterium]|nr:hypothetical protein [Thermoleophilia bacterium]